MKARLPNKALINGNNQNRRRYFGRFLNISFFPKAYTVIIVTGIYNINRIRYFSFIDFMSKNSIDIEVLLSDHSRLKRWLSFGHPKKNCQFLELACSRYNILQVG